MDETPNICAVCECEIDRYDRYIMWPGGDKSHQHCEQFADLVWDCEETGEPMPLDRLYQCFVERRSFGNRDFMRHGRGGSVRYEMFELLRLIHMAKRRKRRANAR